MSDAPDATVAPAHGQCAPPRPAQRRAQSAPGDAQPADAPGRTVLVTGGSRGIGAACVRALREQPGIGLIIAASRHGTMPELPSDPASSAAAGTAAAPVVAETVDCADDADLSRFLTHVRRTYGPVDILIHCAGVVHEGSAMRPHTDDWREMCEVGPSAALRLIAGLSPTMLRQYWGRIVLVSSVIASRGGTGLSAYGASKAALEGIVRSTAREFAPRGVTVNAVSPGYIVTDMTAPLTDAQREHHLTQIPARRFGHSREVAGAVAFLTSDAASYVTGAILPVDGGLGMGR